MHVQIVTFNLDGVSEGEYIDIASQLAPRFAAVPGLLAKVWLESPESGVYGAVYLWDDQESMDRFVATNLFEGTNRAFANLVSEDFSVLENLTRATQPVLTVLEDSRAWPTPPAPEAFPKKLRPAPRKAAPAPAAAKTPAAAKRAKVTKVAGPTRKAAPGGASAAGAPAPAKARSRTRKATP